MTGIYNIVMPDIGEGVTEAEITEWSVNVGDPVREDDVVAEVMTDKATVEIPSPVDGIVAAITGEIGEIIAVGTVIVRLEVSQEGQIPGQTDKPVVVEANHEISTPMEKKTSNQSALAISKPLASPAVRRRADEAGIDLTDIDGSGPGGRILPTDLDAQLEAGQAATEDDPVNQHSAGGKEIKVIGLRRKIAEHMEAATRRIAHMTYVEELDVTELETLRKKLNSSPSSGNTKLTVLPFLMIAMIRALKKNPKLNAHYDDEAGLIKQFDSVHLGMATQTSDGLMVPVITSAETLDIWELANEIARLAESAKSGKIRREELTGSTITLSSLGAMGGLVSTPIINAPEVAIIGVNKIAMRPVWHNDQFIARKIINLSSSFDHRVIDGWDAATFIQDMKTLVEKPVTLLEDMQPVSE